AEDWQLVFDELAAAVGEDGRTAGETRPVLLAAPGGESFDETFICQHVGTDSWAAASVGIAEATVPKKTIPISSRNGELSEKAGSGSPATGFQDPEKGGCEPVGPSGRKYCARRCARRARLEGGGCILATAGGPKN